MLRISCASLQRAARRAIRPVEVGKKQIVPATGVISLPFSSNATLLHASDFIPRRCLFFSQTEIPLKSNIWSFSSPRALSTSSQRGSSDRDPTSAEAPSGGAAEVEASDPKERGRQELTKALREAAAEIAGGTGGEPAAESVEEEGTGGGETADIDVHSRSVKLEEEGEGEDAVSLASEQDEEENEEDDEDEELDEEAMEVDGKGEEGSGEATSDLDRLLSGAPRRVQRFLLQKLMKVPPTEPTTVAAHLRRKFPMRIIDVNRTAKVTKGGKVLSLTALVVCGNMQGAVGFGKGKSSDASSAVEKAYARALDNLHFFERHDGRTIPQAHVDHFKKTKVYLWPGRPGVGMKAGGTVGGILRLAGFTDIKTKVIGSRHPHNTVKATFKALSAVCTSPGL